MKAVAYVVNKKGQREWVTNLPGPANRWGYTNDRAKALPLLPMWQKEFEAECRRLGRTALFIALHRSTIQQERIAA
jgi:hypothetical protein